MVKAAALKPLQAKSPGKAKHSRGPWHNFARHHQRPIQDLAAEWAGKSAAEKAAFADDAGEPDAPEPVAAEPALPLPWPHAGDDCYPLTAAALEGVSKQVVWQWGKSGKCSWTDFKTPDRSDKILRLDRQDRHADR